MSRCREDIVRKHGLEVRSTKIFTNYLLQSKEGKDLCIMTVGKFKSHLRLGIIDEVVEANRPPYEKVFRFNIDIKKDGVENIEVMQEICAVCGSKKYITIHHIVPKRLYKVIRRINNDVPFAKYTFAFLCTKHHNEIEISIDNSEYGKQYYSYAQKKAQFELEETDDYKIISSRKIYESLMNCYGIQEKAFEVLDKRKPFWREYRQEILSIDEEKKLEHQKKLNQLNEEAYEKHFESFSQELIDIHGSPDKVYEYFLQFLLDMNPTENIDYLKLNRN